MGSQEAIVNFYDRWILPPILDLAMRQNQLQMYRREVVAAAHGRVLEVGIGSGLNFPLYGRQVETVVGIDPSPRLLAIARRRADAAGVRAELLQGSATAIPLADSTIDTVVMTWTLCSIADPLAALREMRRVLKPDGKLLFVEHGSHRSQGSSAGNTASLQFGALLQEAATWIGRWTTLSALPASIWPSPERNTQRASSNGLHVSRTRQSLSKASRGGGVNAEGRSK
jgi:ubiquinone/menaquinone biosynthesis C-methylase UbiE